MKANDIIKGFKILKVEELPEGGGTAYEMVYEKNGAKLLYLDRDEDNKTFMVGFRTIPEDDTGVFHILEHSVLNGSEKYPVREPFVELLKSSLQTFLNAFTARDMTMYPVASRNHQDFLNLMDVYLDAVFHPLCIKDDFTLKQEGWRYELDEEGKLTYNGVVFNEMKGDMAAEESLETLAMERQLFPDNCYSKESGGVPESITDLSFEKYCASYGRYYHPGNSLIVLDGNMEIEEVLSHIHEVLKNFDMGEEVAPIPLQKPVSPEEVTIEYEISPEEEGLDRTMLSWGWVVGKYDEPKKQLAFTAILKALSDNNEAPLRKALIDRGLAEDVDAEIMGSGLQRYLMVSARNTAAEKKREVYETIENVFREQAGAMDHKRLSAIINKMEFQHREKEGSWAPRGLTNAMNVMGSWAYGGDPLQNLKIDGLFKELRRDLDENYFEKLIGEFILNNPHQARVCAFPSVTLGEENRKKEREKLDAIWNSWNDEEKENLKASQEVFRERQMREDSPEELATLPALELKDIPREAPEIKEERMDLGGRPVLYHPLDTNGIEYLDVYFDASDFGRKELPELALMARLLGQVPTEERDLAGLRNEIEGKLGTFSVSLGAYGSVIDVDEVRPYLMMSLAVLRERKEDALQVVSEVIKKSLFSDRDFIYNILHQLFISYKQDMTMSGNSYAKKRAQSYCTAYGVLEDAIGGISMLEWLKDMDEGFDERGEALCRELKALSGKVFSRERMVVSHAGEKDMDWIESMTDIFSTEPMGPAADYSPASPVNEGFQIPAEIGFAAKAFSLKAMGVSYSGAVPFASQAMSYDYLWNRIRVQGGAYGTGLSVNPFAQVTATTFRDPQTGRSLEVFDGIGEALSEMGRGSEPIDKYIISTIGELDPLLTARTKNIRAVVLYLTGRNQEREQRTRDQLLNLKKEELIALGEVLDKGFKEAVIAVVGGENQLEACKERLDRIRVI